MRKEKMTKRRQTTERRILGMREGMKKLAIAMQDIGKAVAAQGLLIHQCAEFLNQMLVALQDSPVITAKEKEAFDIIIKERLTHDETRQNTLLDLSARLNLGGIFTTETANAIVERTFQKLDPTLLEKFGIRPAKPEEPNGSGSGDNPPISTGD